jgi:hypothetical protein
MQFSEYQSDFHPLVMKLTALCPLGSLRLRYKPLRALA